MITSRQPWLRVSLCLIIVASGLFPAVPAFAATVQTQGAVQSAVPRIGGIPIWSDSGGLGSPRLGGSGLAPSLLSTIPFLPAPEVKVDAPLSAPAAVAPVSPTAFLPAAPAGNVVLQSVRNDGPAGRGADHTPVSLFQDVAQVGDAIGAAHDQGGEKTGQALDSLYGESLSRPAPTQPAVEASNLDQFVDFAKGLFFPDGRAAGVISHRGAVRPESMPTDEEMRREMELSPLTYEQRLQAVVELFKHGGAKPEEIVLQDAGRGQKNVYVVKKGRTDRVIVVGSHHDKVDEGAGTIDNWTGTTLVTNLYQAMHELDTEATYVFASFAREEDGLIGSAKYLKSLTPQQRQKIDAMVNLDTLAVDGTFSWQNNSTQSLLDLIKKVAATESLDLKEQYLDGGDADSSSFRHYGISALTIFGASPDVIFDIIHSARDTMAAFSMSHYKNAYLLTLALLKMLNLTPVGPDRLAPAVAA